MIVTVGDRSYTSEPDAPIMITLTAQDKVNIASMPTGATRYAVFADDCPMDREAKLDWMRKHKPENENGVEPVFTPLS